MKMKRKVIQLAGKTLVVSLPSKWARKYNIKKGDEMHVEEKAHKLLIGSDKAISYEKTRVDIVGLDPMVKRTLGALYKAGYDEVEIMYGPKELETAQQVTRDEFIGFEIVYGGKRQLTAKRITHIDPDEFDTVMRRIFLIILQMAEQSIEAFEKNDHEWLKSIIFMEKDTNKYADFCRRILNKYGYAKFRVSPPLYYITEQLEKVGDGYRDICSYVLKNNLKVSKELLVLFGEVNEFFKMFYELYYKFDLKQMARFGKKRYELVEKFDSYIKDVKKDEDMLTLYLYTLLDNVFDMNGPLMAAKL